MCDHGYIALLLHQDSLWSAKIHLSPRLSTSLALSNYQRWVLLGINHGVTFYLDQFCFLAKLLVKFNCKRNILFTCQLKQFCFFHHQSQLIFLWISTEFLQRYRTNYLSSNSNKCFNCNSWITEGNQKWGKRATKLRGLKCMAKCSINIIREVC